VSFAAITLYVASQRVFIVVSVYFVIDSVRKFLNTLSYINTVPLFIVVKMKDKNISHGHHIVDYTLQKLL
jgi:hypothetical protein